jgi:hypothetical protein
MSQPTDITIFPTTYNDQFQTMCRMLYENILRANTAVTNSITPALDNFMDQFEACYKAAQSKKLTPAHLDGLISMSNFLHEVIKTQYKYENCVIYCTTLSALVRHIQQYANNVKKFLPVTAPVTVPVTVPVTAPVTAPATAPVTAPVTVPVTAPTSISKPVPPPSYSGIKLTDKHVTDVYLLTIREIDKALATLETTIAPFKLKDVIGTELDADFTHFKLLQSSLYSQKLEYNMDLFKRIAYHLLDFVDKQQEINDYIVGNIDEKTFTASTIAVVRYCRQRYGTERYDSFAPRLLETVKQLYEVFLNFMEFIKEKQEQNKQASIKPTTHNFTHTVPDPKPRPVTPITPAMRQKYMKYDPLGHFELSLIQAIREQ